MNIQTQRDERCQEALDQIHRELAQLNAREKELKNVISTIEYIFGVTDKTRRSMPEAVRKKIAKAQRNRWRNNDQKKKSNYRAKNSAQPSWKGGDDDVIITTLKSKKEPQSAPEFARSLLTKLPHRSEGAIRQRLGRLAEAGTIKQHVNGKGVQGMPHMMVEAA